VYWQLQEHLIPRPVWSNKLETVPVITITHVPELLRLVLPEDAQLFGVMAPSKMEDIFFWKFPIPPVLMRPSRSGRSQDDLSTRLRLIIKANAKHVLKHHEINVSLCQVDEKLRTVTDVMKPPLTWKPRFQRSKATIVPFHLETYFELQRQCAGFQDSRLYTKTDMDYGRELSSIRHRFCATRQRRGRIRDNVLGKRGDFTARAVACPCDYIDPHEVALPMNVCMNLTMEEKVCTFNYDRLLQAIQNGPDRHPGANFLHRGKQSFKLPMFCHEGLQLGDVVSRHLIRGDMILVNRQPSLHRFSMMGYRVVPTNGYTIGLNLSVTPALNLDFDGDEVNAMLCRSMNSLAEAHTLVAVEQNMFKDGHLLVKFVQHACLGVYLLTLFATTTLSRSVVHQLSTEARLTVDIMGDNLTLTGRQIVMRLLPGYDGQTPMDKTLLNRLGGRYLEDILLDGTSRSRWVGAVARFFNAYLMYHGSTIGHMDCIHQLSSSAHNRIAEVLKVVHTDPDERRIIRTLDRVRDLVGTEVKKTFDASGRTNHLLDIVRSGAKGNMTHVVQNAGMVGQQLDGNSRRPPALVSHDVDPLLQCGFVQSSFSDGLNSVEFFHHLKTARVGLVGTAVSTAETGYCYRRISKCLEDIQVGFDHSIRTASNEILLPHAGFETDHVHLVSVRFLYEDITKTHFNGCSCGTCKGELDRMYTFRETIVAMKRTYRSVHLPFDIRHFPHLRVDEKGGTAKNLTCCDIVLAVTRFWNYLLLQRIPESIGPAFFDRLSSKTLYQEHGVKTQKHLDTIFHFVEHRLCGSLYAPGTPIGLIASQSFSEPLTQMQLNQFHQSGEESELTGGVVRIKEILNCSQNIKTPSMKIVALEGHSIQILNLVEVSLRTILDKWSDLCPVDCLPTNRLYLYLKREIMTEREVSPRQVADSLRHTIFVPSSPHAGATLTYASIHDDSWWVAIEHFQPTPLRALYRLIYKQNPLVSGIRNIRDAVLSTMEVREIQDGQLVKCVRPCVTTLGSNLTAIFALPWVDKRFTTTNDQMEVFAELGIDAACRCIEEELVQIMMSNTASVIRKYVRIISNTICRTGTPCALTFAGLTNSNTSILKLATFERSLESFTRAAMNGHVDSLRGTSESLVVGKPVNLGTGGQFTIFENETEPSKKLTTSSLLSRRQDSECWYPDRDALSLPLDIEKATYLPLIHARPSAVDVSSSSEQQHQTPKKGGTGRVRKKPLSVSTSSTKSAKRRRTSPLLLPAAVPDPPVTPSTSSKNETLRVLCVDQQGGLLPRKTGT
jgi:DNA-directed RNA polymerase beta' subunit